MSEKRRDINHILIMSLSTMGDVAMTIPVINGLREAYPEVRISILTKKSYRPLFVDIERVDFIDYDPSGRHKGFRGKIALAKDIKAAGIDAIADLNRSCLTWWLRLFLRTSNISVAKMKVNCRERQNIIEKTRKVVVSATTIIELYTDVFARLGFTLKPSIPKRQVKSIPEILTTRTGDKRGVWIGVAPFARHEGKIYPMPLMDKLIGLLNAKYEKVLIFGGGAHERSFAEGMEVRHNKVVSVIGRAKLAEELAVMSNVDVMVVMDSASMHIASLLGVPTVSIWGTTHPYLGAYGFGQNIEDAVQLDLKCRPCSLHGKKRCSFGDYKCLADITPEEILATVERCINRSGSVKSENQS